MNERAGAKSHSLSTSHGYTPRRAAAFFDLDKTIIAANSATAFSRPFYNRGLINRRSVLRGAYAQFLYMVGSADHDQTERMREYLSSMSAGWDVQQVRDIVSETLHEHIDPRVYDEAISLIEEHHNAGRDVIIVSASGEDVVRPIGKMLKADHIIATKMEVKDGKYTGEIDFYAYGENKALAMRELAEKVGYDLSKSYAYSDSITDEPMLAAVGHPAAVNPDRALKKIALENDWDVLRFTNPVSLQTYLTGRRPAIAGGAIAAVTTAAAIAVVWRWTSRKRHLRTSK